jgi:hypothetical protein
VTRQPFPWVVLVAYAVLWAAPRINRWLDQPPRPERPTPPTQHVTPTQVRILRPGRELDRPGGGS